MQRIIASLAVLGWWTQWLLFSAMWWMAFLRRHQAAAILREGGARHSHAGGRSQTPSGHSAAARIGRLAHLHPVKPVEQALHAYGAIRHPARFVEAQTSARLAHRPPAEERSVKGGSKQPKAAAVASSRLSEWPEEPVAQRPASVPQRPQSSAPRPEQDSVVMKDAFAVQRGEKPKLGFDFKDPEL